MLIKNSLALKVFNKNMRLIYIKHKNFETKEDEKILFDAFNEYDLLKKVFS